MRVVAILETMWGATKDGETAPPFFKISRTNHSGKRLYELIGPDNQLVVTNACREYVTNATQHGKPDKEWLWRNLSYLDGKWGIDVLLVCGKVAQKTLNQCGFRCKEGIVIEMPHPAARFIWTPELIAKIKAQIQSSHSKTPHPTAQDALAPRPSESST